MPGNVYKIFSDCVDSNYSYNFAKKMEENKTNPKLGYRTAGSDAEKATAEMIADEMRKIGLKNVTKDEIQVDGWEFTKADMTFTDSLGTKHDFTLGSYQTDFDTEGKKTFEVVYVGKGTAADYKGKDVTDKLVLVDIDQRNEWWINYPVYQAYLKGAAAFIAVQIGGYGEINDDSLNAQDIAGPEYAPAFSISRRDAAILKKEIALKGSATVVFDAKSEVWRGATSYNVWGEIEGKDASSALLMSAHYDSYFTGFQDDNSAVAMMLSIARSIISMDYAPRKTMRFCAFAAEEWGIVNSKYDWSTGAYQQLFKKRRDWRGTVYAGLNIELPACRHGRTDAVYCAYEYNNFYNFTLGKLPLDRKIFPYGIKVVSPVETWSDDFTISIAGIPSSVNDFSDTNFMTTTYHSQFDDGANYAEDVYRYHHVMYGGLALALDKCACAPLDFTPRFEALKDSLGTHGDTSRLRSLFIRARELAFFVNRQITNVNSGRRERGGVKMLENKLLKIFADCENAFVRLNWQDEVMFPHEIMEDKIGCLEIAERFFREGRGRHALKNIYSVDNNRYAFEFDKAVFTYFTQYVLEQPLARLQWGAGRVICHESLFDIIASAMKKIGCGVKDFTAEADSIKLILDRMTRNLSEIISEEEQATLGIIAELETLARHFSVRKASRRLKGHKTENGTAVKTVKAQKKRKSSVKASGVKSKAKKKPKKKKANSIKAQKPKKAGKRKVSAAAVKKRAVKTSIKKTKTKKTKNKPRSAKSTGKKS